MSKKDSIRRAMLWAAYGDALGFITELCSKSGLSRRTGGVTHVSELIPWKRKIGGKFGIQVELRKGCYSDDTQLRLATCRSIMGDGHFDVETFSKVELPVWLSYALGAGVGSKVAAESLKKNSIQWNSNFFKTNYSQYINGGGNGAAMRIQPHVLSAPDDKKIETILKDVIRNTITTHGHTRAVIGSVFHALILYKVQKTGKIAGPETWLETIDILKDIPNIVESDEKLGQFWLPHWENEAKQSFKEAINKSADELVSDIRIIQGNLNGIKSNTNDYSELVKKIGCFDKSSMGSAPKTALLAAYLSYCFQNNPHEGIVESVNLLGSDTDTIATMAGAILGLITEYDPPEEVMDFEYINSQSDRLYQLSQSHETENNCYPDLLFWRPPLTQIDTIGKYKNEIVLMGFGKVVQSEIAGKNNGKYPYTWQWLDLEFGQTIIAKTREKLELIDEKSLPIKSSGKRMNMTMKTKSLHKTSNASLTYPKQKNLWDDQGNTDDNNSGEITLDQATGVCIKSKFDEQIVGKMLMGFVKQKHGIEKSIAFAAIIAKAKQARMKFGDN
ncbi:MAG: ADP-ribosylglycohydrolase family protein [Planctomycetes bacterium]|nr:ADP-ribosylglycohydrolase family protein [Planctomycetota bacterium]